MPRLRYDLSAIPNDPYVPDVCRARLETVQKTWSKAHRPMLEFKWRILSGPNKGLRIASHASLRPNSLRSLKEHLKALGLNGKVRTDTDKLAGIEAVLVLTAQESTKKGRDLFVSVSAVKPKGWSAGS